MSEYCGPQEALDFPYPQNPLFARIVGNGLDRINVIPQFARFFEIDPIAARSHLQMRYVASG